MYLSESEGARKIRSHLRSAWRRREALRDRLLDRVPVGGAATSSACGQFTSASRVEPTRTGRGVRRGNVPVTRRTGRPERPVLDRQHVALAGRDGVVGVRDAVVPTVEAGPDRRRRLGSNRTGSMRRRRLRLELSRGRRHEPGRFDDRPSRAPLTAPSVNEVLPGSGASGNAVSGVVPCSSP